jgi:hypothetical protein
MLQKIKVKTRGKFEHFKGESLLHLDQPYQEENEKEIQLFFPKDEGAVLRASEKPFTHLKLGVPIEIGQKEEKHELTIELVEGSGDFSLHLLLGPPMEGNYWILALKALRRSDQVTLRFKWSPLPFCC